MNDMRKLMEAIEVSQPIDGYIKGEIHDLALCITELENIARMEGLLTLTPLAMLEPVFYLSPLINLELLLKILQQEQKVIGLIVIK